MERERAQGVRAGFQQAPAGPGIGDRPRAWRELPGDLPGRGVHQDPGPVAVRTGRDRGRHERGRVGRVAGDKPSAGRDRCADPVDPERPPLRPGHVIGHQVPAVPGADQPVRLDDPAGRAARAVLVVQPQPLPAAAGRGEPGEPGRVDGRVGAAQRDGGVFQRGRALAQPGRQHLVELGERAHARLGQARHRVAGRAAQAQDDGDRLVVVEQERRQRPAGPQPVAAGHPGHRVHGVVQVAQPLDVTAQRPDGDPQPARELRAGPVRPRLQQSEQP